MNTGHQSRKLPEALRYIQRLSEPQSSCGQQGGGRQSLRSSLQVATQSDNIFKGLPADLGVSGSRLSRIKSDVLLSRLLPQKSWRVLCRAEA